MTTSNTYHHGNLRQALLDIAIDEIRAHGVEKLSLRALARALGVSQTAPYRHFSDKNTLLAELAANAFNDLAASVLTRINADNDTLKNMVAAGRAYIEFGLNNPEKYRLMFGLGIENRENYEFLATAGNSAFEVFTNLIYQGQQQGVITSESAGLLANACWSSLHGFVLLSIDGLFARRELPASLEDMLQHQMEFILRSLVPN